MAAAAAPAPGACIMRPVPLLFLLAAGLLASAGADAQGCSPCGPVPYARPAYVVAAPAPVLVRRVRVAYAGPGVGPCLACAAMAAFPPPAARVVYDLRTGTIRMVSPW
jgi:hypothetical protein